MMLHTRFGRLDGRVAVVTGGTGHLGRPVTCALAAAGAIVLVLGRNRDKLDRLADYLKGEGFSVWPYQVDISDQQAVHAFTQRCLLEHQRVDIIVNNAYSGAGGTLETVSLGSFTETYMTNVAMPALLTQGLKPGLLRAAAVVGSASVINISSMYGSVSPDPSIYGGSGMNNPPNYGPAKAALLQLTRYLACHWARDRIRVNAVSPGPFPPEIVRERSPEFFDRLESKVPMGRVGDPSEMAGPVTFLATHEASSFVTGANLAVDGGWTAW